MQEPPITVGIRSVGSDPADATISLVLEHEGGLGSVVHFHISVIGPLLGALAAEAGKLSAALGGEGQESLTLKIEAVRLDVDHDGVPVLVFELVGGSILPLAVESGDLAKLASEVALLAANPKGPAH